METWVDSELRNWSRWANSGPSDKPRSPGSCLGNICVPDALTGYADELPPPIHEENAKRVQKVYDFAITVERKVLQAEYLSPWKYGRNRSIQAAANTLELSTAAYETVLTSIKKRVERAFS